MFLMECASCEARKQVMTQGAWKADAAVVSSLVVILILVHGGTMSNKTRKMLTIAFVGAIGAVLIDGVVKPRVGQ